jgi:hypothetical protein
VVATSCPANAARGIGSARMRPPGLPHRHHVVSAVGVSPWTRSAGANPYKSSASVIAGCRHVTYRMLSTVTTSFGGTQTSYASGATHLAILTPPKSFAMATASPAVLKDYGISAEPPAAHAAARALWVAMAKDGRPVPIPNELFGPPAGVTFGEEPGVNHNAVWSGNLDFLPQALRGTTVRS